VTTTTVAIGTIAALISLVCWALFLRGVFTMVRSIAQGQKVESQRFAYPLKRFGTMMKEFVAHTRMNKFRTVGWAHWLVMIGFLLGSIVAMEAYIQTFNPEGHWPIIGGTAVYHFIDELLGIGTVVGIIALVIIRQLNHPRVPARMSRFGGSNFRAAYFVEAVVLIEGLGMIMVKAGKIATYGHANPWTDFFTMNVAKLYGMIHPGDAETKAVRAVFVIDPKGIVRTIIYYPLSTGRNVDELLRIVKALQTADEFSVATPADWQPGEPVIVPPPGTSTGAQERMEGKVEGVTCVDWFFCTKEISEEEIESRIRA